MESVANLLQRTAMTRRQTEDFDIFARSAFNRYYYSVFLIVRDEVKKIKPDWDAQHSGLPGVLTGDIYGKIQTYRRNNLRRQDADAIDVCNRGLAALDELANLMRGANAVRVIADYNPNVRVLDEGEERFSLGTTNITTAHNWPNRARVLTRHINRAWSLVSGT